MADGSTCWIRAVLSAAEAPPTIGAVIGAPGRGLKGLSTASAAEVSPQHTMDTIAPRKLFIPPQQPARRADYQHPGRAARIELAQIRLSLTWPAVCGHGF